MGDWNVDQYRHPWDCDEHWEIRKEFMLKYMHMFPEEKLVCLAQVYTNIELLGCRYPPDVMKKINHLAAGLKRKRSAKQGVGFVKASTENQDAGPVVEKLLRTIKAEPLLEPKIEQQEPPNVCSNRISKHIPITAPSPTRTQNFTSAFTGIQGYAAADIDERLLLTSAAAPQNANKKTKKKKNKVVQTKAQNTVADKSLEFTKCGLSFALIKQLVTYLQPLKNKLTCASTVVGALNCVLGKCRIKTPTWNYTVSLSGDFVCEMLLKNALVGQGSGANKKLARAQACFSFISHLNKLSTVKQPKQITNAQSGCPFPSPANQKGAKKKNKWKTKKNGQAKFENTVKTCTDDNANSLSNFVLFASEEIRDPVTILQQSAAFNKRVLTYDFDTSNDNTEIFRCSVKMNGELLATVCHTSKATARQKAAEQAVFALQGISFTIRQRVKHVSDQEISKGSMEGPSSGSSEAISDDNIGNKLMRQMGWTGGGLGKGGHGIAEPITIKPIKGRNGLGSVGNAENPFAFRKRITKTIRDYINSGSMTDLVFTAEFSQEERKLCHMIANKFGLKSHSYGKEDKRYLVLSRKWTPQLLMKALENCGGSTEKYSLVPPGSYMY